MISIFCFSKQIENLQCCVNHQQMFCQFFKQFLQLFCVQDIVWKLLRGHAILGDIESDKKETQTSTSTSTGLVKEDVDNEHTAILREIHAAKKFFESIQTPTSTLDEDDVEKENNPSPTSPKASRRASSGLRSANVNSVEIPCDSMDQESGCLGHPGKDLKLADHAKSGKKKAGKRRRKGR